jgi:23S rRNA pseudouridine1911/1915/1917 synthase
MPNLSVVVEEQILQNIRLDRYVSEVLRVLSRSQIKARNLKAKINKKDVKLSHTVKQGDILELSWDEKEPDFIVLQDIPLEIIYEDENCVVINKAQGMVVHPGAGNRQGTLVNALCFRRSNSGSNFTGIRPGIVHRLDRETSGIIIAAYNDETHAFLARQFYTRKTKKTYIAVICGIPKEKTGRIETFIARDPKNRKRFTVSPSGKTAVTLYKVIKTWKNYSLIFLRPKTGRTHQLRVHMRCLGHPILGDSVYGCDDKKFKDARLMLHSKKLEITLPGEARTRVFSSNVPERFLEVIKKLNKEVSANGK